jgi:predicted enzyme related to lactoylglutathione lyase
MQKSQAFYEHVFGMKAAGQYDVPWPPTRRTGKDLDGGARYKEVVLQFADASGTIKPKEVSVTLFNLTTGTKVELHRYPDVVLRVQDLDSVLQLQSQFGGHLTLPKTDIAAGYVMMMVADPAGNVLEIVSSRQGQVK